MGGRVPFLSLSFEINRYNITNLQISKEFDAATLALTTAASVPTSRRAAAAAATLTIANVVASENGTALLPMQAMPMVSQPPPASAGDRPFQASDMS